MNKNIEVLKLIESEYKMNLQLNSMEINHILQEDRIYDNIDRLKEAISKHAENYARLQMVQRIKEQVIQENTKDEN